MYFKTPEPILRLGARAVSYISRRAPFGAAPVQRSLDAMAGTFMWMLRYARTVDPGISLADRAVLEVGGGRYLVHAATAHLCGATVVVSVDKFRQASPRALESSISMGVLAHRLLSSEVGRDDYAGRLHALQQSRFDFDALRSLGLDYRAPADICDEATELAERFDLVFTYAMLEHVKPDDLRPILSALEKCVRPGGTAIHFVGIDDHNDPARAPLAFLAENYAWNDDMAKERGNRIRFSEWQRHFHDTGSMDWTFPYRSVRMNPPRPERLDPTIRYHDEEDLRTSEFLAVGKKPS